MNTKKCTIENIPDPSPPEPCLLQKIREKEKAGIKICPKPPTDQPPPPPHCFSLCIERVKNPPVTPQKGEQIVCLVERERTGTERCDAIRDLTAAHADIPWPGCTPPILPPPTPPLDPCEEQARRMKAAECTERKKRYMDHPSIIRAEYKKNKWNTIWKEQTSEVTRQLTIENPMNSVESSDIDQHITQLECLIKNLQNEIIEITNNSDNDDKYFTKNKEIDKKSNVNDHISKFDEENPYNDKDLSVDDAGIYKDTTKRNI